MAISLLPSVSTLLKFARGGKPSLKDGCKSLLEKRYASLIVIRRPNQRALPPGLVHNRSLCVPQQNQT